MSVLKRSEAIILKGVKFGESSEILSIFTREMGKIKAVAKGKRRPKSHLAASLEPFKLSEIVFYFRPDRDLQLIKEAKVLRSFDGFREDYRKASLGFGLLELLEHALPEHTPHEKVFQMTLKAFEILERSPSVAVHYAYKVKFLSFMGHRIETDRCVVCRRRIDANQPVLYFSPRDFGPICKTCYLRGEIHEAIEIGQNNIEEIKTLMWGHFYNIADLQIHDKTLEIIDKCVGEAFHIPINGEIIKM